MSILMFCVVGLGNPDVEYADTRHNAGFNVIELLSENLNAHYWKNECGSLVTHCKNTLYKVDEIALAKPQSYMNLSGGPVKNIKEKFNLDLEHIFIVHDDMDIEPGSIRVKRGGSSAGHNGLKSITQKLGTDKYIRIRVGIGRPPGRMPFDSYVLQKPKGNLYDLFMQSCQLAKDACIFLFEHSLEQAQQEFNRKNIIA